MSTDKVTQAQARKALSTIMSCDAHNHSATLAWSEVRKFIDQNPDEPAKPATHSDQQATIDRITHHLDAAIAAASAAYPTIEPVLTADGKIELREKPATLYDWSDPRIPAWVQWIATDVDGIVFGYGAKPKQADSQWCFGRSMLGTLLDAFGDHRSNWRDSLEQRPQS